MAPSTPMTASAAQEQLLASLLPKTITTGKSRKYRETFNRRIKHHNYGRTNQFEVIERLDGLEEKFQIWNRDDLSDALRLRRAEMQAHENERRFLPDLLDLLTRLSVDPANIKRSDRLIKVKEKQSELPPLRWVDVEQDDPINHMDAIWQNPDHSDLSSDEGSFARSNAASSPQSVKRHDTRFSDESTEYIGVLFDDQPVLKLERLSENRSFDGGAADSSITITELQATRESLFMLQGLPTKLYSSNNTMYEADPRYRVNNISREVFWETLRSFAQIGNCVEFVRGWLRNILKSHFTRKLQRSIADFVSKFNAMTAEVQVRLLQPQGLMHVGLLSTLEATTRYSKDVFVIRDYLQACEAKEVDSIGQLETLFDLVCSEQVDGNAGASATMLKLFVPTLEEYLKPVVHWMSHGELHENMEIFFIAAAGQQRSLSNLWDGWFVLNSDRDGHRVPRFLEEFLPTIFSLGKTALFLRNLDDRRSDYILNIGSLLPAAKFTDALKSDYLNFAEAFREALRSALTPMLTQKSALLHRQLDHECGLWAVLDAFDNIYFGFQGPITDSIDKVLFRRLDKCNASWSDRFLLLDVFQGAFADISELDTDRLVIHSSHTSSRSLESRRKSVKVLGDLSIDYSLPWQIANIIPQILFTPYRRVSLFLMQIRRSRYSLERRAHIHVMNARLGSDIGEQNMSRALFQKLLLFNNILYSHLTIPVLGVLTSAMKTRIRQASTMDEMKSVHSEYLMNLERACLISKKLSPIRDTIIAILDLAVRFSDIVSTPPGHQSSDDDARSYRSAASRHQRRREQEDSESDEDEINSGDEGYSTFIVLDEPTPTEEFKRMSKDFDRHLDFVIAGLRSLGRVDGQESWDILAGRLDWKQKSKY